VTRGIHSGSSRSLISENENANSAPPQNVANRDRARSFLASTRPRRCITPPTASGPITRLSPATGGRGRTRWGTSQAVSAPAALPTNAMPTAAHARWPWFVRPNAARADVKPSSAIISRTIWKTISISSSASNSRTHLSCRSQPALRSGVT